MKKSKKTRYPDFDLVPNTSGVILDGVYLKKDKSEIIIAMAWGGVLRYKPLKEGEESL